MATRTSAMISQEQYLGSWRGRSISNNIGWEMFPGKTEETKTAEDPDQVYNDRRKTLMDTSPVQGGLFPEEEPRRDTYAKSYINLREGGFFGRLTQPWANDGQTGGSGFDISFHDKDPRGWSTEQPWREYRRLAEVQFQNTDFTDDSDNSTPSAGIHPNTMYKQIRAAQNWVRSRLKVFSEEWEGKGNGGVGIYPETSKIYRSDQETSGVGIDNDAPSRTFDDPEIAQHHNINISNVVNMGSKFLRANTTTDNLVKVAAYNKLYKDHGLINHETQLRILEDDTPWSNLEGSSRAPRNLVKLMANQVYSDNPNISPYTASEIARILMQKDQWEPPARIGISRDEMQLENRNFKLTQDIIALLGFTEQEIKYLESLKGQNNKHQQKTLADLQDLVVTVHRMSPNEKLQMRNELILRSAGMGLTPATGSDIRKIQDTVVVNPKIIQFMSEMTKKNPSVNSDFSENREKSDKDPEAKLDNLFSKNPLFIYRTPAKSVDNISNWEAKQSQKNKDTTKKVADYKHLDKFSKDMEKNTRLGITAQLPGESNPSINMQAMLLADTDHQENLRKTALDNHFGDNRYLNRHGGRIGTKQMRRHMSTDYMPVDGMIEVKSH